MGLEDRDYMRARNRRTFEGALRDADRPFTPPQQRQSLITMIGWWVLVAFALYKLYGWTFEKSRREPSVKAVQPYLKNESASPPLRPATAEDRPDPTVSRSRQQSTYTPPPSAEQKAEVPTQTTSGTIYLCKDYSGGTFWASNHCVQHRALIDRIVSVPEGLPFQQQVQIAEQRRQAIAPPDPPQTAPATALSPSVANKARCESLEARVNQLDAMARQPQSGATQDWIRSERHKTRDEQFRLRC